MASHLFIYGTLLLADNKYAKYLSAHSTVISKGTLRGYLYDVGHYPAAIADATATSVIHGFVLAFADDSVLNYLDPYEGFGEGQPKPYLFVRKVVTIETDKGGMDCWAYLYNHTIAQLKQITSGDYLSYIK